MKLTHAKKGEPKHMLIYLRSLSLADLKALVDFSGHEIELMENMSEREFPMWEKIAQLAYLEFKNRIVKAYNK